MAIKHTIVLFAIATALLSLAPPPPSVDAHPLASCHFEQIYQLGDSISDTGNLIREFPIGAATPFSRPPYGDTYFHDPTGRCSNGLLMIDYLALASGIPFIHPIKDKKADFRHGANFAVAGATAISTKILSDKKITNPVTNSSLDVQIKWMEDHFETFCKRNTACSKKLQNALFMVGEIGGNDYNYAFISNKTMVDLQDLVPQVVSTIKDGIKRVIDFGARNIVVPGNFPIGCFPIYLTNFQTDNPDDYDENHCLKGLNSFARLHNNVLLKTIRELQKEYPHVTIVYGDYYNAFNHLLKLSKAKGFVLQRACCGVGGKYNFNEEKMCGHPATSTCSDPSKYISWDGVHPTQEAYHIMTDYLLADFFWKFHCFR